MKDFVSHVRRWQEKVVQFVLVSLRIIWNASLFLSTLGLLYVISIVLLQAADHESARILLEYFRVLVWPVTVLILVFLFKTQIGDMLARLKGFESPLGTAAFSLEAERRVEEQQEIADVEVSEPTSPEPDESDHDPETVVEELRVARMELEFERINRVIFGSQFELLKRLKIVGSMPAIEVEDYYQEVRQKHPALKKRSFIDYIGFLEIMELVSWDENVPQRLKLTEQGSEYLAYVEREGMPPTPTL